MITSFQRNGLFAEGQSRQRGNTAQHVVPTLVLEGREGDDPCAVCQHGMLQDGGQILLSFGGVQLIHLRGDHEIGDAHLIEKGHHSLVVGGQADAAVHQLRNGAEPVNIGVFGKKSVGQILPFHLILLGALGKAVAGEVNEKQLLVDFIEIDGNGLITES